MKREGWPNWVPVLVGIPVGWFGGVLGFHLWQVVIAGALIGVLTHDLALAFARSRPARGHTPTKETP